MGDDTIRLTSIFKTAQQNEKKEKKSGKKIEKKLEKNILFYFHSCTASKQLFRPDNRRKKNVTPPCSFWGYFGSSPPLPIRILALFSLKESSPESGASQLSPPPSVLHPLLCSISFYPSPRSPPIRFSDAIVDNFFLAANQLPGGESGAHANFRPDASSNRLLLVFVQSALIG